VSWTDADGAAHWFLTFDLVRAWEKVLPGDRQTITRVDDLITAIENAGGHVVARVDQGVDFA
jgi:hypothetical protein